MRLLSYAKTWPQYVNIDPGSGPTKDVTRRFKFVWTDGEMYFSKRPRDRETWKIIVPSWWNHQKGEPTLKPGEITEGCEWSPRVGLRWCCRGCGLVGGKAGGKDRTRSPWPACDCDDVVLSRLPVRGVLARHIKTEIVTLGRLPSSWSLREMEAEPAREGFPDLSWDEFLDRCFPRIPRESKVARIEFERIEEAP